MTDKFVFKPCIPPNSGASGPVNDFGQQRYVVLRIVAEKPGLTRDMLHCSMTMADAHISAALDKLIDAGLVAEAPDTTLTVTRAGAEKLENL